MAGEKQESAVPAGSSATSESGSGNKTGQPEVNLDDFIPRTTYEELEKKLGEQGSELGSLRKFFNELSPLLDKLDANPEIVEAMREGKLDGTLAKAILEDKITVAEAKAVAKANDDIKKDMGEEKYKQVDPDKLAEQIMEKVSAQLSGVTSELKKEISEVKAISEFEKKTADFIAATPDYDEYADMVTEYVSEHPEQEDIELVYHLVKGRALNAAAAAEREKANAEAAKSSAPQGSNSSRNVPVEENLVEKFVHLGKSANTF